MCVYSFTELFISMSIVVLRDAKNLKAFADNVMKYKRTVTVHFIADTTRKTRGQYSDFKSLETLIGYDNNSVIDSKKKISSEKN